MILDLIRKNRSYRRFDAAHSISRSTLEQLVEAARLSPSAANLQNLRFYLSCGQDTNDLIFPHLRWAGYLDYWDGPSLTERPAAYILLLCPKNHAKHHHFDAGIAAQSILLMATEMSLGGCMIASVDRDALLKSLNISDELELALVIALGKPAEQIILEDLIDPDDIEYYRDAEGVHHVPKRTLKELIVN